MLAHYRREGGISLNVWRTDSGAQANLGYVGAHANRGAYTVECRGHFLTALERVLDVRNPDFDVRNNTYKAGPFKSTD